MFRRKDNLIVTQAEHSRLSGELAALIGGSIGFENRRLFGAIAVHDWPHFAGPHVADTIEIGTKTDDQQLELVERLQGKMPFDAFTELIVRMHWRRLSDPGDIELQNAIDSTRIKMLLEEAKLTQAAAICLDRWTDLCDSLSFYLSRGESAEGCVTLEHSSGSKGWPLEWETRPDALLINGVEKSFGSKVSLLAYDAVGYPAVLVPMMLSISCAFAA